MFMISNISDYIEVSRTRDPYRFCLTYERPDGRVEQICASISRDETGYGWVFTDDNKARAFARMIGLIRTDYGREFDDEDCENFLAGLKQ